MLFFDLGDFGVQPTRVKISELRAMLLVVVAGLLLA
jgi:hypothetical protein